LEITIEHGRFENSVLEGTPQAEVSQRILRLSLGSAGPMHFGDAVSRCDRSVIGGLLEEQVKYLT
jgi:hypothetical protein